MAKRYLSEFIAFSPVFTPQTSLGVTTIHEDTCLCQETSIEADLTAGWPQTHTIMVRGGAKSFVQKEECRKRTPLWNLDESFLLHYSSYFYLVYSKNLNGSRRIVWRFLKLSVVLAGYQVMHAMHPDKTFYGLP